MQQALLPPLEYLSFPAVRHELCLWFADCDWDEELDYDDFWACSNELLLRQCNRFYSGGFRAFLVNSGVIQ
jgi:hypothetical protein